MNYLPSKKFLTTFSLVLSGILVFSVLHFRIQNPLPKSTSTASVGAIEYPSDAALVLESDSDGDGLQDWEENLYRTDAFNNDTDSDGIADGEEIKNGTDPLGGISPDGITKISERAVNSASSISGQPITETDVLARKMLTGLFTLEKEGNLNANTKSQLVASLIGSLDMTPKTPAYTEKDVSISTNVSISSYRESIRQAMDKHVYPGIGEEMTIVSGMMQDQTVRHDDSLARAQRAYEAMANDLLVLDVPPSLFSAHLNLVNGLASMASQLPLVAEIKDDPIKAITAIKSYSAGLEKALASLSQIGI